MSQGLFSIQSHARTYVHKLSYLCTIPVRLPPVRLHKRKIGQCHGARCSFVRCSLDVYVVIARARSQSNRIAPFKATAGSCISLYSLSACIVVCVKSVQRVDGKCSVMGLGTHVIIFTLPGAVSSTGDSKFAQQLQRNNCAAINLQNLMRGRL